MPFTSQLAPSLGFANMTPALWASLIGAVVLLLTNTAALVKVFADNAKIRSDRVETKSMRDKDSLELHDKVLKLEFGYTTLKDSQQLINEQLADTAKAVGILNTQLAQVLVKLDNVIDELKELKQHNG